LRKKSIGDGDMPVKLEELWHGDELKKFDFSKLEKGGVIMDVTDAEQAVIAADAGAMAVMALERVPADIRAEGGVARMADPLKIREIKSAVKIPVMAKCRIGHFAEAQILQALGVDIADESEVLTVADPFYHVQKDKFTIPFVCGARDLGEAVRRIWEGAVMIRTKGEAGTGNIVEAVRHQRLMVEAMRKLTKMEDDMLQQVAQHFSEGYANALRQIKGTFGVENKITEDEYLFGEHTLGEISSGLLQVLKEVKRRQRLPVVNLAAGGIATPADAVLMMQLGSDGVFVGSGIFKSQNPKRRAEAVVEAVSHFDEPGIMADVSKGLSGAMKGIEIAQIPEEQRMQRRGL